MIKKKKKEEKKKKKEPFSALRHLRLLKSSVQWGYHFKQITKFKRKHSVESLSEKNR